MKSIEIFRVVKREDSSLVKLKSTGKLAVANTVHKTPIDVANFVRKCLKDNLLAKEEIWVLPYDSKGEILGIVEVVIGTTNSAVVDPASVLQPVLLLNAIDFIIVHNHPSGSCEPSEYDHTTTKRMREAGDLIGLRMTDHLVMGERQFWSFTNNRRLNLKEE